MVMTLTLTFQMTTTIRAMIVLRQPLQPIQLPPTQPPPTQLPLRQPSQPTQPTQPELNAPITGDKIADINILLAIPAIITRSQFASSPWSASSSWSAKRQDRNAKVTGQEILTFLRENSKLKREQRRENSWFKREHREAVLEAERQQREAALESLKSSIIDVTTLFINWLPKSNSTAKDPPEPDIPLKVLVLLQLQQAVVYLGRLPCQGKTPPTSRDKRWDLG
eukprot:jgi/Psemu1/11430/gm1.11430_g